MINVISIKAPRPAVDWFSTAEGVARAEVDPLLPEDRISISPEARGALARAEAEAGGKPGPGGKLSPEQQRQVTELQQRDAHVRSHEAAHQAAGGDLTGPASFSYELGPDGRSYAVGGEVPISMREGDTPEQTIAIAQQVRAAALAPADPSGQDLRVAAEASAMEARARMEAQMAIASALGVHARFDRGRRGGHCPSGCGSDEYSGRNHQSDRLCRYPGV